MTRVVVQRGQGTTSNSSQNRATAPPSSAALPSSSPPPPPPLPPPPPPFPPRPSAPYSHPSSSCALGHYEADSDFKLESLFYDVYNKTDNRTKEHSKGDFDFVGESGDGRREHNLTVRPNIGHFPAESREIAETSDKKSDDRDSSHNSKGSVSLVPPRLHNNASFQTYIQSSSDQAFLSQTRNCASMKDSSSSSSMLPPNLACTEVLDDVGLASRSREALDQSRSSSLSHVSENAGSSFSVPSSTPFPLSSSSQTLGSSRWSAWTGMPSGNRAAGSSQRPSWNIKALQSSLNRSRSTSPRSHEGDGYNSSDELSWASGQTTYEDAEERERQFEIELRRAKGLELRRMAEDGNCLFRAIADQVYGDPEMYDETRQLCIDYMETERDHFSQFVTESFTAYCKRKRRDKVYGNNLEIQAMAEIFNRPIHIHSYSTDPINIFHGSYETDLPPIRLSYHRGNHYNSLHDPSKPTVGAGLGFGSLHGTAVDRDQVKAAIKAQQDQQIDKALLAEGRYYSDLELTEQEIEHMVIEESRAEFLAEEKHRQHILYKGTSTSAGAEPSSSGTTSGSSKKVADSKLNQLGGSSLSFADTSAGDVGARLNNNVRMLVSMGFSYIQVMEAVSIFGDDVNDILCYLLEIDSTSESIYRMKGKAAER
ncbi:hypothetical protein O6H91_06G063500 [Diphasiastrum complanatum]|uniref:Uncharacterized protein n=1 Tax=Diphasiastrum complanatum TaxID=34168 RepID=A0ACC2DEA2_DIPCM|nr:hypothetical protein O6H91_06G063500 [Diphasiastrum complanatum]